MVTQVVAVAAVVAAAVASAAVAADPVGEQWENKLTASIRICSG